MCVLGECCCAVNRVALLETGEGESGNATDALRFAGERGDGDRWKEEGDERCMLLLQCK